MTRDHHPPVFIGVASRDGGTVEGGLVAASCREAWMVSLVVGGAYNSRHGTGRTTDEGGVGCVFGWAGR
ncbi:hypothetical protein Dimus_003820 [Dionaea muscipula]